MEAPKNLSGKEYTLVSRMPADTHSDPPRDANLIRVFDHYGREHFVTKEQWRTQVLPDAIKSSWDKPTELYDVIVGALNDGLRSDVIVAAEHLYRIDPQPVRSACLWGIILTEENRLGEAEKVFRDFAAKHGDDGYVLINLAKVYAKRNNHGKAEETLWHALEIEPNQESGMGWYQAIHRERGGEEAGQQALRKIAALSQSWRAQLWLARAALEARNLKQALAYYQESLSRIGKEIPADVLMQISGDLGNSGHLPEILELCGPRFVPDVHGLQVGNNLLKAHLDLGQVEPAHHILNQLYALKRPDWQNALRFWDAEIAKARLNTSSATQQLPLNVITLAFEGPIWLNPSSPAADCFEKKTSDGIGICFLGSSAEALSSSQAMQPQLADPRGRLSRALPLFFAEHVNFNSTARVQTLMPWKRGERSGFLLSGAAWTGEEASIIAKRVQIINDYVVTTHIKCESEPWTIELQLVRTIDGICLGMLNPSFPRAKLPEAVLQLAPQFLDLLVKQIYLEIRPSTPLYEVPSGVNFPDYLLRLEQLLAVRCGGMDGVQSNFLNNEHELILGNIQLCLACPHNPTTRLLLAQTMLGMKRIRPDIVQEFKDKVIMLQAEHPLPERIHGVVQRILDEAWTKTEKRN
jgi:tetratricopeptide (TPR) repeat protein